MTRKRIDKLLVDRGLCATREEAQRVLLAGLVFSGDRRLEKAGTMVAEDLPLELRGKKAPFASRAGEKLRHALDAFHVDVQGQVCLDIGASTGGFTDCLLQRGAARVFAVDVGYGQLDSRLRNDPRVVVLERTNSRALTRATLLADGSPPPTFLCADVSFIGLAKAVLPLHAVFPEIVLWVLLFKPQFEVGPEHVGRGGRVKDDEATQAALARFLHEAEQKGLRVRGKPELSPVPGKKSGNEELLVCLESVTGAKTTKGGDSPPHSVV